MKRRVLKKEVKVFLATVTFFGALVVAGSMPNTDYYEVRTMRVYDTTENLTLLIDGNNEIYGMYDKVYDEHKPLLVTIDTKGTKDLRDDEIVSWVYRNW